MSSPRHEDLRELARWAAFLATEVPVAVLAFALLTPPYFINLVALGLAATLRARVVAWRRR